MAGQTFKDKLLAMAKGHIDPETMAEFIKTARAHAGGKGKAEKAAQAKTDGMAMPMDCAEFSDVFIGRGSWDQTTRPGARLFVETDPSIFVELGKDGLSDWFQVVPGPGKYNSPKYGKVVITPDVLQRYKENFDKKVYQEHIPLDAEHKTKLSGALGYYRELKVGHNGKPGLWARVELTERGQTLLDSGGFKYFSPEFYDEWEDPAQEGVVHKDVLTGGAFTTRPFFKDKSLEPIAASELEADEEDDLTAEEFANVAESIFTHITSNAGDRENKEEHQMAEETKTTPASAEAKTETVDAKQFAELQEKNAATEATLKSYAEQNKQMAERLEQMAEEGRKRQFTETVMGRGGENDGGPQWFGEISGHVTMMEKLHKAFGEDSEELKSYVSQQNSVAKAMSEAGKALGPIGSNTQHVANGTEGVAKSKIKAYMEAHDVDEAHATIKVLEADPKLYSEYDAEQRRRWKDKD